MHVSNVIAYTYMYVYIDLFAIAYIYNVVLYINSLRCYLQKILYLKIIFPLRSKFYARNCPIATYLQKIKYIFYCLNLNTNLDPGLDEETHYKNN